MIEYYESLVNKSCIFLFIIFFRIFGRGQLSENLHVSSSSIRFLDFFAFKYTLTRSYILEILPWLPSLRNEPARHFLISFPLSEQNIHNFEKLSKLSPFWTLLRSVRPGHSPGSISVPSLGPIVRVGRYFVSIIIPDGEILKYEKTIWVTWWIAHVTKLWHSFCTLL